MIYITGATGRLGREVLKHIRGAIPLVRKKNGLKGEILTDFSESSLKRILRDVDAVIHLAASLRFGNRKELYDSNVGLTKKILDAMPTGAKIIYASSTAVYGKAPPGIAVTENTPCNPQGDYGKTKHEAEKLVLAHGNAIAIRMPPIYGENFVEYYAFIDRIKRGKAVIIGGGSNRIPFVHVEDAAKAIANALKAKPGVYLVSGESLTQKEVYDIAARALGVSTPRKHIPKQLALMFAGISKLHAHISGKAPKLTKEQIEALSSDRVFDSKKAKKELKFRPRPLEHGIKEMVANYEKKTPNLSLRA